MAVAKTYQGYFTEDVRLIANGVQIKLPATNQVVVKVLDEHVKPLVTKSQRQKEALSRLYAGLADIDNEPIDAEFDALVNQGFNIGRELNL